MRPRIPVTRDFGGTLTARIGRRFAAGPTVDDALARAADVRAAAPGVPAPLVTLEYVAHPARTAADAGDALDVLTGLLARAGATGLAEGAAVDVSVPLPVLGSGGPATDRLDRLAAAAAGAGGRVTVRPHRYADVDAVLDAVARLRPEHPDLGVEVWAALRRTAGDLQELVPADGGLAPRVVLRRGGEDGSSGRRARSVPSSLGLPTPTDADRAFVRYAKRLLHGAARPTFAPGDATLIGIVEALADAMPARPADRPWELQMELGRRQEDVQRLLAGGRRVRIAVPFGPRWRAVGLLRSVPGSGLSR